MRTLASFSIAHFALMAYSHCVGQGQGIGMGWTVHTAATGNGTEYKKII